MRHSSISDRDSYAIRGASQGTNFSGLQRSRIHELSDEGHQHPNSICSTEALKSQCGRSHVDIDVDAGSLDKSQDLVPGVNKKVASSVLLFKDGKNQKALDDKPSKEYEKELPQLEEPSYFFGFGPQYSFADECDTLSHVDPNIQLIASALPLETLIHSVVESGYGGMERYENTNWKSDSTRYFRG